MSRIVNHLFLLTPPPQLHQVYNRVVACNITIQVGGIADHLYHVYLHPPC